MSKTGLKKLIAKMDKDQLGSLILNLYAAKKDAKDYLDFFVDPDIDKRLDKAKQIIDKSIFRVKRGIVKPKLKNIKDAIKSISSLTPGDEYVAEIMTYSVERFFAGAMFGRMSDTTLRSVLKLMKDTILFADKAGLAEYSIPRIESAIENLKTDYMYRREFKRIVSETFKESVEDTGKKLI